MAGEILLGVGTQVGRGKYAIVPMLPRDFYVHRNLEIRLAMDPAKFRCFCTHAEGYLARKGR